MINIIKHLIGIVLLLLVSKMATNAQAKKSPLDVKLNIEKALEELEKKLKPRKRIAYQLRLVSLYEYSHKDVDRLINSSLSIAEKHGFMFYVAQSLKKELGLICTLMKRVN